MWEFAHRVCARPVYTREESTLREQFPDHPTIVAIRGRGRVTLPKAARDRLSLEEGDQVLVVVGRRTLEVVPVELVTRDQLWSMTGSVRDHIEAAENDLSAGRSAVVDDPRALSTALQELSGGDA